MGEPQQSSSLSPAPAITSTSTESQAMCALLVNNGWGAPGPDRWHLTQPAAFGDAIDAVVSNLAAFGYFPTRSWFRQGVEQGSVAGAPITWLECRNYTICQPTLADLPADCRYDSALPDRLSQGDYIAHPRWFHCSSVGSYTKRRHKGTLLPV